MRLINHLRFFANRNTLLFLAVLGFALQVFTEHLLNYSSQLDNIKERGRLIVGTLNGPTTYYENRNGAAGLEYDLAYQFAQELEIALEIVTADSVAELHNLLLQNQVDFIASGTPISDSNRSLIRYSSSYQTVYKSIVDQNKTRPRPRKIDHLDEQLTTLATPSHIETLTEQRRLYPELEWNVEHDMDYEELIEKVANKKIRYALVNSNEVQAVQHYYPELRVAFMLSEEKDIAWGIKKDPDISLYLRIQKFHKTIRKNNLLTQLIERYYGHIDTFDYAGTQLFLRRIDIRLPTYEPFFKHAAKRHKLDWLLLAAMSHQESQWNRNAVSPTGVRGLMMLTLNTASQLGVTNRLDPQQSIDGGTKYFADILKRLPSTIKEPDRTWMAMAAYNIGYGHLLDARRLTLTLEKDPDKWIDVKETLPLLRKKKWYKNLKYGYARGDEAVHYVQNIRRYHDILIRTFRERLQNPVSRHYVETTAGKE